MTAHDQELKQGFEDHLKQTEGHVQRLKRAFEMLGQTARAKPCNGMMGLIEEGKERIQESKEMNSAESDLSLIAVAQKVELYEISGYGTLRTIAEKIGQD